MRALITTLPLLLLLSTGCGHEIGDSCSFDTECSPAGDRICDGTSPDGYCTVFGCDFDSCPEESVCVRFFSVNTTNLPCNFDTEDASPDDLTGGAAPTNDCNNDELCTISGTCAPRLAESRFCMRTCESNGDCRDGYECRDRALMEEHGGEPVVGPDDRLGANPPRFCAAAPVSS